MEFRLARYADADSIVQIDERIQADRSLVNFIHKSISSRHCFVAVTSDGYVIGYGVMDNSFFDHGFIAELYVDPQFRERGVASGLIRHLEEICKSDKLFLAISESNQPMLNLLEKLEYRKSGFIENLDADGPLLVYSVQLQTSSSRRR